MILQYTVAALFIMIAAAILPPDIKISWRLVFAAFFFSVGSVLLHMAMTVK